MLAGFGAFTSALCVLRFFPGEIGAWARNMLANFALAFCLLVLLILGAANQAYQYVSCKLGDNAACYYNSYINYTVEGWTAEQLKAEYWRIMDHKLDPKYYNVSPTTGRRWALLRDEWYDGQVIKTRQLCITWMTSPPASGDHCFDRQVITGKHKGEYFANPYRQKPITQSDYNNELEIYKKLLSDWNDSIW